MTTRGAVSKNALKDATKEEVEEAFKHPYDLKKPHKRVVTSESVVIIQNGQVYEEGSGKHLGPTTSILEPSKGVLIVPETGATFPDTPVGKARMEKYKERNGIGGKPKDNAKIVVKEATIDERKEQMQDLKAK